MSAAKAIGWGGLIAGILDIADAFIVWSFRSVPPHRVLQGIAAGLLGRESFQGGAATATLGLFLHFVIAFGAATVYYVASRKLKFLVQRPLLSGLIYGIFVYLFMNFVVLPLSAAGKPSFAPAALANGLFAHMVLVGLPIAFATRSFSVSK